MNIDQLHKLIERYFNADTTVDEERLLKIELAHTHYSSPLIDEARAVLGYSLSRPTATITRPVRRFRASITRVAVAASIVIAAIIPVSIAIGNGSDDDNITSYALVDGNKITDNETIDEMMRRNLSMLANANADMISNAENSISNLINIQKTMTSNL